MNDGGGIYELRLSGHIPAGLYFIQLTDVAGKQETLLFCVQD